jgi:diguanylate cyclase (GGDEF)-like protein/PAS domain S-box-containing protein
MKKQKPLSTTKSKLDASSIYNLKVDTNDPKKNQLIAALSFHEFLRLRDDLELVQFGLGDVVYNAGDSLSWVYFPTNCIVSLVFSTKNGDSSELAMTGCDGLVGIPLVLGGDTTTHRAVVQSAGSAFRLKAEVMRWELDQSGELHQLSLRYTQALMTQMAQSVVCNRHHTVDQQLCRWLLLSLDRLDGVQLCMTQELIGNMLGVRREAVNEAAGKLQASGLITYARGSITVLDRPKLEARVCECYSIVKTEYDRLFAMDDLIRIKSRTRPNPTSLRKKAEARWLETHTEPLQSLWDAKQLVQELEVHKIELEMHNEALSRAYEEADVLRERYADIYDFSPVGYFATDPKGSIIDVNLAGAILIGIKRSFKNRYRFDAFISSEYLPVFRKFLAGVFSNQAANVCEVQLLKSHHELGPFVQVQAVPDESGAECRMVVMDISERHRAELLLEHSENRHRHFIEKLPLSVAVIQDGMLKYLNPKGIQLTGYHPVDCINKPVLQLVHEEDHHIVTGIHHPKHPDEKVQSCCEIRLIQKTGSCIDCRLHVSAVEWEGKGAVLALLEDITDYKKIETELRLIASTDSLTKLSSRGYFLQRMEEELSRLKRGIDQYVTVAMIDLDHFKLVNDSFGHAAGDAVLRHFARELREELRNVDIAGRIGGEEFAVLLPQSTQTEASIFAERFRKRMEASVVSIKGHEISITVSIGIASMCMHDDSADQSLIRADDAMYRAKDAGRNRIEESQEPATFCPLI